MKKPKAILSLFWLVFVSGCGVFGAPSVKTGQCYDYCLQVTDNVTGGTEAVCYDTEAKMLAGQRAKRAAGLKAVRK
jgi:hypothetical protein